MNLQKIKKALESASLNIKVINKSTGGLFSPVLEEINDAIKDITPFETKDAPPHKWVLVETGDETFEKAALCPHIKKFKDQHGRVVEDSTGWHPMYKTHHPQIK